jgi:hypothetical protein
MEERMKDHLVERSDDRVYRFMLICSVCGDAWTGPELERSAMDKITARYQTAEEARKYHRMCAFCINPVCNNCFEEVGPIRLCARCAARLKAKLEQL